MGTVTGYTAARMKEIEDSAIIDGDVIGNDLLLTRYDGAQINAGSVRGPQGIQGPPGSAALTQHFYAYRNTYFTVPNETQTNIPMNVVDQNTIDSGSWNGTTFTLGEFGLYSIGWSLAWLAGGIGARAGYIWDGASVLGGQEVNMGPYCILSGQTIRRLNAGTQLYVAGWQASGASLNLDVDYRRTYLTITPLF